MAPPRRSGDTTSSDSDDEREGGRRRGGGLAVAGRGVCPTLFTQQCTGCWRVVADEHVMEGRPVVLCSNCAQRAHGVARCLHGWLLFPVENLCPSCVHDLLREGDAEARQQGQPGQQGQQGAAGAAGTVMEQF